jgi:limonene 1,2-monooxygenase
LHVAETRKEALDDVRAGFDRYLHGYWEETIGFDVTVPGVRRAVELEAQIENGGAIVGSVEDVVNGLNRLHERSGGFGTFLVTVLDWTSWEKTIRSFDLLARYVAPHFTGSTSSLRDSIDWAAQSRARANAVS